MNASAKQKTPRLFISYAWTGEDQATVETRMSAVVRALRDAGYDVYINLEDRDTKGFSTTGEYVTDAIQKMESCDAIIIIKTSERRSEGQLMEIGAAIAYGIPRVLCLKKGLNDTTYLDDPLLSASTISWGDDND